MWGDEQLLERALRNLLQNAADAEEEAGRASRSLIVRIDLAESAPTIIVDDQGTGLHPEIEQRLFVPFSSHKRQGIGLGLALARRILDLHGATLELENRDGGGARAIIRFPAVERGRARGSGPRDDGADRERTRLIARAVVRAALTDTSDSPRDRTASRGAAACGSSRRGCARRRACRRRPP